jgi:hypothetical protein
MAYEFKKLSDVNVIESMKDGLNVLVEDGGEIVKISADSIVPDGIVKSVNGEIPDENGNIEVSGLPEGSMLHQQLVTDADGVARWEERTHYTEMIHGCLYDGEVTTKYGWNCVKGHPISFNVIEGEMYTVIFDGVTYEVEGKRDDNDNTYIGCHSLWIGDGYNESEPPFCYGDGYFGAAEDNTHTVRIDGADAIVHKLDAKYIGPTIYYVDRATELFYKNPAHTETVSNVEFKRAYLSGGVLLDDGSGCLSNILFAISEMGDNNGWLVKYYCYEGDETIQTAFNYIGINDDTGPR